MVSITSLFIGIVYAYTFILSTPVLIKQLDIKFVVSLLVFGMFLGVSIERKKYGSFFIDKIRLLSISALAWIFLYWFLGKSTETYYDLAEHVVFWMSFYMLNQIENIFNTNQKKRLLLFILMCCIVEMIWSIYLTVKYPFILNVDALSAEQLQWLETKNFGTTDYSYLSVFILLSFIAIKKAYKTFFIRNFSNCGIIISLIFLFCMSRLIAMILLGICLIYLIGQQILKKFTFRSRWLLFLCLLLISVYVILNIDKILYYAADYFPSARIADRLFQLAEFIDTRGKVVGIAVEGRLQAYLISIETFIKNPIFGIGEHGFYDSFLENGLYPIGMHSEFFDTLAEFGIMGGIFWIVFYRMYYKRYFEKIVGRQEKVIIKTCLIGLIITTILGRVIAKNSLQSVLIFILPLLGMNLTSVELKRGKINERDN